MTSSRAVGALFVALGVSLACALGGAACTSQVVSLGDTGADASARDAAPDAAFVCPEGFAHPNLCCQSGGGGPSCVTSPSHPFETCPSGRSTVVYTTSCCPREPEVSGFSPYPAGCFDCSPSGACVASPPSCPSGERPNPGDLGISGACCHDAPNGFVECCEPLPNGQRSCTQARPRDGGPPPTDAAAKICSPSDGRSCNDDPNAMSPHGTCSADGTTCSCTPPFQKVASTGKCT